MRPVFSSERLQMFFVEHLNRIYCAKSHLVERLPEIEEDEKFSDLTAGIRKATRDMSHQVARLDKIYQILGIDHSFESCSSLINFMEDSFLIIMDQNDNAELREMFIVSYLFYIESIEIASSEILKMIAGKANDPEIKQLVKENYDSAKVDRDLAKKLTTKYILD